jgi:2-polyprenyl-6-methoxyphenol hydroxylase-like FAD-dependent oxidoreductase
MENTRRIRVLISGASIGGPALAYWLGRQGHEVTVVERAAGLRPGGQAVDFKGATHRTVLNRMGILDDVRKHQTGGNDIPVVDRDGRRITVMPGEFTGGEIEIQRGDLARLLYERSAATCLYVFGDSIASMTETPHGVDVTFEHAEPATYDLVVGADGIHSNVRGLAFGPESNYVKHLGYYYALADIDTHGAHGMYNEPGRMVSVGGSKAAVMFVFASDPITYDRYDIEQQKRIVASAYANGGWRVPQFVSALPDARDVYLDSISHVTMDAYARGRTVLLGDAGYGNTLGGFGTGLAVVGAYVLAGEIEAELARPDGDISAALRRYTEVFRPYARKVASQGSAGKFLAPATRRGIRMRNWVFKRRFMMAWMLWITDRFATNIELRDYPLR